MGDNSIFYLAEDITNDQVIECPESRSLNGISNRQYVFDVRKELAEGLIPDNGLMSPDGWGYFDSSQISLMPGPIFTRMVLGYTKTLNTPFGGWSPYNSARKEAGSVWSMDLEYTERDLSELPNYRTKWNYNLYQASDKNEDDFVADIPEWAATAKDLSDDNNNLTYKWGKDFPSSYTDKNGKVWNYYKIQTMDKPGIEAYHKTTAVVVAEVSFKKLEDAQAYFDDYTPGTLITPSHKFGLVYDNNNFLYEPDGIQPDGDWWITVFRFVHSQTGWDTDIYKVGT